MQTTVMFVRTQSERTTNWTSTTLSSVSVTQLTNTEFFNIVSNETQYFGSRFRETSDKDSSGVVVISVVACIAVVAVVASLISATLFLWKCKKARKENLISPRISYKDPSIESTVSSFVSAPSLSELKSFRGNKSLRDMEPGDENEEGGKRKKPGGPQINIVMIHNELIVETEMPYVPTKNKESQTNGHIPVGKIAAMALSISVPELSILSSFERVKSVSPCISKKASPQRAGLSQSVQSLDDSRDGSYCYGPQIPYMGGNYGYPSSVYHYATLAVTPHSSILPIGYDIQHTRIECHSDTVPAVEVAIH